jgi:hypothetical protein
MVGEKVALAETAEGPSKRQRTEPGGWATPSSLPVDLLDLHRPRSHARSPLPEPRSDELFPRVLPHLCSWMPRKEYLGTASASRACFHHSLAPLKHKAFLAVVKAQRSYGGRPFPLQRLADAVARVLPPGSGGLSGRALLYLRTNLRAQAVSAWWAAGMLLLTRVGERVEAVAVAGGKGKDKRGMDGYQGEAGHEGETGGQAGGGEEGKGQDKEAGDEDKKEEEEAEEREWPVEAAPWSSRITTADMRMALTLADHWETTTPMVVAGEEPGRGGAVMVGDPFWESVVKGLAREAGVVDFDDGALHLLLHQWDKCLRAAAAGRRDPGDTIPAVRAAPVMEQDPGPALALGWVKRPPGQQVPVEFWASDLRVTLLASKRVHNPWPTAAELYSPRDPPWPEFEPLVVGIFEGWAQKSNPSVQMMQLATQVGIMHFACARRGASMLTFGH